MTRARIVAPRDDYSDSLVTVVVEADDVDSTGVWTFCPEPARKTEPVKQSDRRTARIPLVRENSHR